MVYLVYGGVAHSALEGGGEEALLRAYHRELGAALAHRGLHPDTEFSWWVVQWQGVLSAATLPTSAPALTVGDGGCTEGTTCARTWPWRRARTRPLRSRSCWRGWTRACAHTTPASLGG